MKRQGELYMKNFAFISDFDGTFTEKDFYKIITDEYLKDECCEIYKDWKNKRCGIFRLCF